MDMDTENMYCNINDSRLLVTKCPVDFLLFSIPQNVHYASNSVVVQHPQLSAILLKYPLEYESPGVVSQTICVNFRVLRVSISISCARTRNGMPYIGATKHRSGINLSHHFLTRC